MTFFSTVYQNSIFYFTVQNLKQIMGRPSVQLMICSIMYSYKHQVKAKTPGTLCTLNVATIHHYAAVAWLIHTCN